jgi:hypothetical protein
MTRIEGLAAIEYAEAHGLTLSKYTDPTEEARDGLTVAEAQRVSAEDPSLIYVDVTQAQKIGALFGDDGCHWESTNGLTLDGECRAEGATVSHARCAEDEETGDPITYEVTVHGIPDLTRYAFADGSAIVAGEGGWDYEGKAPFSWAGAE